jgi:hypothetical protein
MARLLNWLSGFLLQYVEVCFSLVEERIPLWIEEHASFYVLVPVSETWAYLDTRSQNWRSISLTNFGVSYLCRRLIVGKH